MRATQFLSSPPTATRNRPVIFAWGDDFYLFRKSLERLRANFRPDDAPLVQHVKSDFSLPRLLAHLGNTGLFAVRRMAILYGAESLGKADRTALASFSETATDTTLLLLRAEYEREKDFEWVKAARGFEVLDCRSLRGEELRLWAGRVLEEHGVRLTPAAATWLLDHTGTSLADLEQAARRIAWVYPDRRAPLSPEEIRDSVADTAERTSFALADAAWASDAPAAWLALERVLELGDDVPWVLGGISFAIRRRVSPGETRFGPPRRSVPGTGRTEADRALAMLSVLSETDVLAKSAHVPDPSLMRQALLKLLALRMPK
ncbi:MAG: hypothetical protein HYY13_03635 [Nitrospirae bacterium]|nr:hypothetical protein [Nitrospirota bacterium]